MSHAQGCRFPSTTSPKWKVLKDVETLNASQNRFCGLRPYSLRFVCVLQGCGSQTDAPHRLRAIVATTSLCHCQGQQGIWEVGGSHSKMTVADWKSLGLWDRREKSCFWCWCVVFRSQIVSFFYVAPVLLFLIMRWCLVSKQIPVLEHQAEEDSCPKTMRN